MSAPLQWFFHREGDAIVCRAGIHSPEMIADMVEHILPGSNRPFVGITYDDLREAGAGTLTQPATGNCTIEPEA